MTQEEFDKLKVGDDVYVVYHEKDGRYATNVSRIKINEKSSTYISGEPMGEDVADRLWAYQSRDEIFRTRSEASGWLDEHEEKVTNNLHNHFEDIRRRIYDI